MIDLCREENEGGERFERSSGSVGRCGIGTYTVGLHTDWNLTRNKEYVVKIELGSFSRI